MRQLRMYAIGMLLLTAVLFTAACGSTDSGNDNGSTGVTDEDGTAEGAADDGTVQVDDILFDTDGDGVYDHTDVDGDGLLEEIGRDANDVADDVVDGITGDGLTDDGGLGDPVNGADGIDPADEDTVP